MKLFNDTQLPIFLTMYCHSGLVPKSPTYKNQTAQQLPTPSVRAIVENQYIQTKNSSLLSPLA